MFNCSLYIRTVLQNTSREDVQNFHNEFITIIEWKFQCQTCQRFVRTRFEDFLLKINANEPNTFESHLNYFLQNKACSCKQRSSANPQLKQGRKSFEILRFTFTLPCWGIFFATKICVNFQRFCSAGEWLFVEVDRSQDVEENSEESEVSLYPLNLVNTYNIADQQYEVFATVNLNLGETNDKVWQP